MALFSLAIINPLLPGNPFFALQARCEGAASLAFPAGVGRARYTLRLAEVRVDDLEARVGTRHELAALSALETSLERASQEIENASDTQVSNLWERLVVLVQRSEDALSRLSNIPQTYALVVMAFRGRLHSLRDAAIARSLSSHNSGFLSNAGNLARAETSIGVMATGDSALPGGLIPFPPGSLGALHTFYVMSGRHVGQECSACHTMGFYRGINNTCEGCHLAQKPVDHFNAGCGSCHTPIGWQEMVLDHAAAGATDCLGCHVTDTPQNHFSGQCSQCHSTTGWRGAVFNHAGVTDCVGCHVTDTPANHFSGQCSQCHTITGWWGATFNHAGYTDCVGCHAGDAPSNHFNGQCSQCHSTTGWRGASFNHAGYTDCVGCHAGDAPNNHFNGQCSQCHNQSNWRDAQFNHSGDSDCIGCHLEDRPGEHNPGQCSDCHDTNTWDD